MPPLTAETLPGLASAQYLYLTTVGRVSGHPRTVELWFVAHEGRVYAVSGDPARTNWVRNAMQNAKVGLRIGDYAGEARARVLEPLEQPLWDTVCRMACEKYGEPEPWGTPLEFALSQ